MGMNWPWMHLEQKLEDVLIIFQEKFWHSLLIEKIFFSLIILCMNFKTKNRRSFFGQPGENSQSFSPKHVKDQNQKWVQEKPVKCFKDKPAEAIWTDKNHEVGEEEARQGNIMYVCCGFSFLSWPENYLQHRYMFLRELCT